MLGNHLKIPDLPLDGKMHINHFPTYALIEKISRKLVNDKTKLLIIDEFQNLFELSYENRREILGGFNDMINMTHIPIVLVGTNCISEILDELVIYEDRSDLRKTFRSRFGIFEFKPWDKGKIKEDEIGEEIEIRFDPDFLNFYHTVCTEFKVPTLTDPDDLNLIIEMSDGLTGKIIFLIHLAAVNWIEEREKEPFSIKTIKKALLEIQIMGWWGERATKDQKIG